MPAVYCKAVPFDKKLVTLALESGVDALIVPADKLAFVSSLARCTVFPADDFAGVQLHGKEDEEKFLQRIQAGEHCVLARGWEIIPIENLLAQSDSVFVEVGSLSEAEVASGILERGVTGIVVLPEAASELKAIVSSCKLTREHEELVAAEITAIRPVGLGHRVCCDTISLLKKGQGLLIGNSSAFTFLVHAETEHNDYVASRPFRVNAGAVHSYIRMPEDSTRYLEELRAGDEVLIVGSTGKSLRTSLGRVKIEIRPMLLIEARYGEKSGAVVLQNAETIRLVGTDGEPKSVVTLKEGDSVLCRIDAAGRHFGMRIKEEIKEV